mmetsp:Transcript_11854/g.32807  ORF Transcript_11854/g.32807 Transcript_11854/m.32807 type:complete len:213 (+) Transcript_11854:43-681(+)
MSSCRVGQSVVFASGVGETLDVIISCHCLSQTTVSGARLVLAVWQVGWSGGRPESSEMMARRGLHGTLPRSSSAGRNRRYRTNLRTTPNSECSSTTQPKNAGCTPRDGRRRFWWRMMTRRSCAAYRRSKILPHLRWCASFQWRGLVKNSKLDARMLTVQCSLTSRHWSPNSRFGNFVGDFKLIWKLWARCLCRSPRTTSSNAPRGPCHLGSL